jgi:hypothetical protein
MGYSPFWRSVAASLILLGLAVPARGADRPLLLSHGAAARTPSFEATSSRIAGSLAGHEVSIECAGRARWRSLSSRYGFDAALTWALTPLRWDSSLGAVGPTGRSVLSPRTCRLGKAFLLAPTNLGARLCRHGTKSVQRAPSGERRGKTRSQPMLVKVPLLGECDEWGAKLLAVHVLGHESMHLAGVVDEATAECLATQLGAFVVAGLGAGTRFSRSLASEYWRFYYPSQDPRYRSAQCRSGGKLDLFPSRPGWPTPESYPPSVRRNIERFQSTALVPLRSG